MDYINIKNFKFNFMKLKLSINILFMPTMALLIYCFINANL